MSINYTEIASNKIKDFKSPYDNEYALDILKSTDFFRPFNHGLDTLIQKHGYDKSMSDNSSKSDYLYNKLKEIGSEIEEKTVFSWFIGEHRPKIEPSSRKRMYEICFALHLSIDEAKWFFQHVYFDRCFNCHIIEEAVYYYCLLHSLSFNRAKELIRIISDSENNTTKNFELEISNPTLYITEQIESFKSENDFLHFMKLNKSSFNSWNVSSYNFIKEYLAELTGSNKVDASYIDKIKRQIKRKAQIRSSDIDPALFDKCGLLLKEIYFDAINNNADDVADYIVGSIENKSVLKNSFVLDRLLSTVNGIPKDSQVPYTVKVNFPSKKTFSDILSSDKMGNNKIESSQSYDMIRKVLILLHFFYFWINDKLNNSAMEGYDIEEKMSFYTTEINDCLNSCGYEPLYPGNPYDWIFLTSAYNEDPTEFFRCLMFEISDTEDF